MHSETPASSRRLSRIFALAFLLPLLAGTASAQDATPSEAAFDQAQFEKQLRNILTVHLRDEPFDWVEATVKNGDVLLTGRAAEAVTPARIERAVRRLNGVGEVYNNVEVLPVSLFDDQLRLHAARAIYSHPTFSHRVLLGSASVHVIVAAGQVQLEGSVATEAEARLAEALVRSNTQNFGVENNLTVTGRQRG